MIVAHLGSGASMCALSGGRSVESTMGFSAMDGLPMGTRPGQIDPGVVLYLIEQKGMSGHEVQHLLYHDCGLKGLSGISNDMRELEASPDPRAAFAIDYFVYRIRSLPGRSRQPWAVSTLSSLQQGSARTLHRSAPGWPPICPGLGSSSTKPRTPAGSS